MAKTKKKGAWDVQIKTQVCGLLRPSLFFLFAIAYQELFLKLYCFRVIPIKGVICTVLFTGPVALLLGLWCCAVKWKNRGRVLLGATAVLCIWMATQTV